MRMAAYARVSTVNQREEGTIELQLEEMRKFAEAHNHEIVQTFCDDGVSGSLQDRPALADLFLALEENPHIEGVLIWKLDRLARDLYVQEHLIKKLEVMNKKILSVKEADLESSDPMRKAFRQFMGIVSELEKSFIVMRLSAGKARKARKGKFSGGSVPFGYTTHEKDLRINGEAEIVRRIFHMRRYQRLSLRKIADALNAENIPSPKGKRWHGSSVQYVLQNPVYRGKLDHNGNRAQRADLVILSTG